MPPRRSRASAADSSAVSSSSAATAASVNKTRRAPAKAKVEESASEQDSDSHSDSESDEEVLKPKKSARPRVKQEPGLAKPTTSKKKAIIESESEEQDDEDDDDDDDDDSDDMALPPAKTASKARKSQTVVKREPASEAESESESDDDLAAPVASKSRRPPPARASRASASSANASASFTTARTRIPSSSSTRSASSTNDNNNNKGKKKLAVVQESESEDASGQDLQEDSEEGDEEVAKSLIAPSPAKGKQTRAKIEAASEGESSEEDLQAPPAAQPGAKARPKRAPAIDEENGDSSSASSPASSPGPGTPGAEDGPESAGLGVGEPAIVAPNDDDDLTASLAERPAVISKPILPALQEETGPKQRLVIHKLALVDFKSYAGRQEIGPFHKSFSSIVGPNGSGKSNTIDALLFVFGFKATKMRQGKLSELIHNSEGREDIPQCSVEVWFREIVDLPGPDAYEVVPSSTLVVSRTAYRNNSSKYTINGKTSSFTEVTTLLKDRGIDLDHKRFLILQGEVESIAQMKPKAPNEHEDGLLEYLEDIIGTSRYKEPIKEGQEEVDKLNEERLEKTNRVKLVEREKSALEHAKKEADGYLRDQNSLTHRQNELYQVYAMQYSQNIAVASEAVERATKLLQEERESQAGIRKEVADLEAEYNELNANVKEMEKLATAVSKELVAFEKEDVQLQEKRKHLSAKQKKLKKSITDDTHARSEATSWYKNYGEDMDRLRVELEQHETSLAKEEAELEKICDGLKDKTAVFSAQIDQKQTEMQPWLDKLGQKKAEMDLKRNERDLLKEKSESAKRALQEAEEIVEKVQKDNEEKVAAMEQLKGERQEIAQAAQNLKEELAQLQAQDVKLRANASSARAKVEEAKANQAASRSKGDVLSSLTKLKDQGRLAGFHGRLGNLGRIDDKYDVAISTAAPGLDNLVCDNVEAGQACLEHLRKNNLGRATILCLNALSARNLAPIETPEGVPRLFDLVTPKDQKLAPAFYQVLQNTLVAKDLTQANRIAFGGQGGKRWRVVTLDGKLIDTSGTMSGGGNRVARGAMSSKIANDEDVTPEAVARLERDTTKADDALRTFSASRKEKEDELAQLQAQLPELEMNLSKTEMAMRAGKKRLEEASKRIGELRGASSRPAADEVARIAALDKEIAKLEAEHSKLQSSVDKISGEIKALQEQILEVGGVRLRSQQAKVNGIKEMSEHASDQLTKAEVGRAKAEKDLQKLEKALKTNGDASEELEEELAILEKTIREKSNALNMVRKKVETAQGLLEEKSEELAAIKADLDEKQGDMNKFRARETELEQELDKARRQHNENEKALTAVKQRRAKLELHDLDEDDDEEEAAEGAAPVEKAADELRELSDEELAELDPQHIKSEIVILEDKIAQAKPNLAVLKEYKRREKEFLERAQDLERITQQRDAKKKACDDMRKQRLDEFMAGFNIISMKLKEMYQMITLGGNAELELVDSLDPFSEGIIFSVMPPKKSWKNISNLSGGEKTLSSLALVFALHVFKPTPLYFMDEIDAALDFRNVSIVANYIKDSTKQAQFIIISLRNNMFELASRLVGIYKTNNCTKTISIDNSDIALIQGPTEARA